MDENSILILKKVKELANVNFFIPAYQRGYRWTENQVFQLLDDVWEFSRKKSNDENEFYCLQPIVVKNNQNEVFDVIDGQQRLTTIKVVTNYFNERILGEDKEDTPIIKYETRPNSEDFLNSIKIVSSPEENEFAKVREQIKDKKNFPDAFNKGFETLKDKIVVESKNFSYKDNIDFYHIANAYKAVHYWFRINKDNVKRLQLTSCFLEETKVIWYEVNESETNNAIDIFTRLNIGKIPLTNSELIKALFLKKENFATEKASLKQIQIASEWDLIERTLQNNDFWYFIFNQIDNKVYETRIEYIFDLMSDKKNTDQFYKTFFFFHDKFEKLSIDQIWFEIKKYFLTFEEWFNDFELYHLIGYLIETKSNVINSLKRLSAEKSKDVFKLDLREMIKSSLLEKNKSIDDLCYSDSISVKKVLLLFNIETILQSKKKDTRFPFFKYKDGNWDIEHVDSITDNYPDSEKKRRDWIEDIEQYFEHNPNADFCRLVGNLKNSNKIDSTEFKNVFDRVRKFFKEDESGFDKDNIHNLALLDSETNRSYKNAFFPIKRARIINNDMNGIFVPIATKNLFLKYYTKSPDHLKEWSSKDAEDYLTAIKSILSYYLTDKN